MSLGFEDINYIALTHIHIDHAGSAGGLLQKNKDIKIIVHEKGKNNLINPERLMVDVKDVYGSKFGAIGEMLPLPFEHTVIPAETGDAIDLGGSLLEVYYTPGHAKHHVVYFDRESESVFSGDALGSKYEGLPNFVLAPPSDYDKESAKESIDLIEALDPKRINFSHCGSYCIENKNFYNELRAKHDIWTECLINIIRENGHLDNRGIFEKFLEKMPELKKYPGQHFSFYLSVNGILLYLKRKRMIKK
jgi:glyoxylase-like metal-dependent hydrolase (beta-lactamase superfamily II)